MAKKEGLRNVLSELANLVSGGSSIIRPGTTQLVSTVRLPESPGVRTFVKRMGGKVSKTGNVDLVEYLRAVAKASDVPAAEIANITDEKSAWEIISNHLGMWSGNAAPEDALQRSAQYAKQLNRQSISAQNEEPFAALVKAVRGDDYDIEAVAQARAELSRQRRLGVAEKITNKKVSVTTKNSIARAQKLVDEAYTNMALAKQAGAEAQPYLAMPEGDLAAAGFSGVRFARNAGDVVDLIRAGEVDKARMAFDDMTFNSMLSVPPTIRNKYLTKHDSPLFYLLSDVRNRWLASQTGMPLNVVQSMGGVGSANAGPVPEFLRVIRGTFGIDWDPKRGFFRSNAASVARSGKETMEPANMELMVSAMNDLVNNKVGGMTIPARTKSVPGLRAKAGDYATQSGSALGARSSVQDMWEHRAPFASTQLPTPASDKIEQNLVLQAVSAASGRQLGLSSLPAAQEMRWKNMHELVSGGIKPSFHSVQSQNIQYPQMKAGEITKTSGLPSVDVNAILSNVSAQAGNPVPLRLQQGLVESMQENPDMWVSVAGTPLPSPTRTFVPAAAAPENRPYSEFADWLSDYADQSMAASRAERLNTIMSNLPVPSRPRSFRSATPYIGAGIPPLLALGLMSGGEEFGNGQSY